MCKLKFSNREIATNGIPQGSILGRILFNIYVHDLNMKHVRHLCVQYADDTSIYRQFKPEHLLENVTELDNIARWPKASKKTVDIILRKFYQEKLIKTGEKNLKKLLLHY